MTEITLEGLATRVEALERKVAGLVSPDVEPAGTGGDEQSDEPDAVKRWLAAFDAIPPAVMTADEEAAWQAARAAQKQLDAAVVLAGSVSSPRRGGTT